MTNANITLVSKRATDGTVFVPFDPDPHPSRPEIVRQMIAHLVETGHQLEHHPGVPPHSGKLASTDGSHVILHSGPMTKGD